MTTLFMLLGLLALLLLQGFFSGAEIAIAHRLGYVVKLLGIVERYPELDEKCPMSEMVEAGAVAITSPELFHLAAGLGRAIAAAQPVGHPDPDTVPHRAIPGLEWEMEEGQATANQLGRP